MALALGARIARVMGAALALASLLASPAFADAAGREPRLLDDFERPGEWSAHPADGVELTLHPDSGLHGGALRADFRFVRGAGYAVLRRAVSIDLPENYEFRFHVRGQAKANNLEFKLIDSTGDNVWWLNRRAFEFPATWDSVRIKRRQIQFAWGPAGGGEIRHVAAIEIAITAGEGGTGSVWFDDLELVPLPPPGAPPPPAIASASSSQAGHGAALSVDSSRASAWRSAAGDQRPWLELNLGVAREFGGLAITWEAGRRLRDYALEGSSDGATWSPLRTVHGGRRGRDFIRLPESEARRLRIRALGEPGPSGCAISDVTLAPLEWSSSENDFLRAVATAAPRGRYPRALRGERSYWTIVGVEGANETALLGEDGALEPAPGGFSIEPLLRVDGRLVAWSDVKREQTLEDAGLPIPSVTWRHAAVEMTVTAVAAGAAGAPRLYARYRVRNLAAQPRRLELALAIRPFQVNPPVQFLGTPGGVARIDSIEFQGARARVNGTRMVHSLTPPGRCAAVRFEEQDVVEDFAAGTLPAARDVRDPSGLASGAFTYAFDLAPHGTHEVVVRIDSEAGPTAPSGAREASGEFERALSDSRAHWRERLGEAVISVPDPEIMRTLRAQQAYCLLNRHGAALEPGPRSYARSWIRDGALISWALLRLGRADVVRDYLEWFAPLQFADGRIPCCADRRGPDPVPELDSNGEFIFLTAEYLRLTGDRDLAARLWPPVSRAIAFLDSMRAQRLGTAWNSPEQAAFRGLLPPSISHEGYSAKPMHSYWDDFFALRGYRDAAWLAGQLGRPEDQSRIAASRDRFAADLSASVLAALALHRIDFVPGCADLGDFDATSTAIGVSPLQIDDRLPPEALHRTFQKYWDFFSARASGREEWEAFTPYELRVIGALARLGERDRAGEMLRYFMAYRRPSGWAEWAEVVWHDESVAHFIGDLPHTWVGAEFLRSLIDLVAFERERDDALVLAAGVQKKWLAEPGVRVRGLPTRYGPLTYTLVARGDSVSLSIAAGVTPPGGVVLRAPGVNAEARRARVNGREVALGPGGELNVRELPAEVTLWP